MNHTSLYHAVWRWHFYAGLLVLPFLVLLAATGGLYLFQNEITHLVYRSWETLETPALHPRDADWLIEQTEARLHGTVLQLSPPLDADHSDLMTVRTADGQVHWAFIDPSDGRVLGLTRFGGVMQLIRKIHSLQEFGFWASCLIEIAAGWAIVLFGTGVFLWWPRGRSGGVVTIRGTAASRVFWRDLHAVTGAFAGSIVLFLAVTGMPWSQVWGARVQQWTTAAGLGEPQPPAETVPSWVLTSNVSPQMALAEHQGHAAMREGLPWALERAASPESRARPDEARAIGTERAIALLREAGLSGAFTLTLPGGPQGAYVGSYEPDQIEDVRVVYLDQFSGRIIGDVGFADFGPAAKAIEWGIHVHQGQEYGTANRYLMLAGCFSILMLAVSSATMWWMRRPRGALGVPPAPADPSRARVVVAIFAPVAILYPLVGTSLVAFCIVDHVVGKLLGRPRLGQSGAR